MYPRLKRISLLLVMVLICAIGFAQPRTINGNITNRDTREPLQGASVSVKGTDRGTTTDAKGDFTIEVSEESVLKISMVGYDYQEIPVGKQTHISVGLSADNKKMDEVVVVGYGTQKKADLTGALSSVSNAQCMVS